MSLLGRLLPGRNATAVIDPLLSVVTVRAPSFQVVGTDQSAAPLIQQPRRHVGVIVGRVPGIVVNTREFRVTNLRTERP
jgi:hypothetical protein